MSWSSVFVFGLFEPFVRLLNVIFQGQKQNGELYIYIFLLYIYMMKGLGVGTFRSPEGNPSDDRKDPHIPKKTFSLVNFCGCEKSSNQWIFVAKWLIFVSFETT